MLLLQFAAQTGRLDIGWKFRAAKIGNQHMEQVSQLALSSFLPSHRWPVRQPSNTGEEVQMIKVSAFLTRRPDLTQEQFIQYWKEKHAPLVMSLDVFKTHVRHYTQQRSLNSVPDGFPVVPYDGVAELWLDDLSSLMTISGHPDYSSIVAKDEENFLDRTKTALFLSSESQIV
jgi:uncharacterized protein (TIGR02118 family)